MFEFHSDKQRYFEMQRRTAADHIIPFINSVFPLKEGMKVLEIGCAEAGVLKAFCNQGFECTGIELMQHRVELARVFLKEEIEKNQARIISENIYDIDPDTDLPHKYDVIILKDVIEHIPDQAVFLKRLKDFLNDKGIIFIGFPPWQMPFGGHQQKCENKFLAILPYYHLLPEGIYTKILKSFGESEKKIDNLLDIKRTGISIEELEDIFKQEDYRILNKTLYLTNPIYRYKFNLKTIKQSKIIAELPGLRNYLSTCAYYVVQP